MFAMWKPRKISQQTWEGGADGLRLADEAIALRGEPLTLESVVVEGRSHRHNLVDLPWDGQHGDEVENFGEFSAIFRQLKGCSEGGCGYRAVYARREVY